MEKVINYHHLCLLALIVACVPTASNYSSATYKEDLSIYRRGQQVNLTKLEADSTVNNVTTSSVSTAVPQQHITTEINALLDSISNRNQEITHVQGYTIQVYNGTSRESAQWSENRVYQLIDEADPKIRYVQPNFKVKVGQYTDRLEVHRVFAELKKEFPNAIIIPERIKISE